MNIDIRPLRYCHLPDSVIRSAMLERFIHRSSMTWIATVDDEVAALWGLIPPTLLSERAYLWLDVTEVAKQHQFLLVRYSQRMIEQMLEEFPLLVGHCEVSNHRAQRWLKWLGAEFSFPEGNLIPFTIRRKQHG